VEIGPMAARTRVSCGVPRVPLGTLTFDVVPADRVLGRRKRRVVVAAGRVSERAYKQVVVYVREKDAVGHGGVRAAAGLVGSHRRLAGDGAITRPAACADRRRQGAGHCARDEEGRGAGLGHAPLPVKNVCAAVPATAAARRRTRWNIVLEWERGWCGE
jgi:hypothetical protein